VEVKGGPMAGRYDWTSQRQIPSPHDAPHR
jgi:hypothetical protein